MDATKTAGQALAAEKLNRRIAMYAAKFLAETPEGATHPEPTDAEMAERFAGCVRPAKVDEYPAIREAIVAQVATADARTSGQKLTAELRANFRIGTRTRNYRGGGNLRRDMIDAIGYATIHPGYYTGARHEAFAKAWAVVCAWRKHVDGYRIDALLNAHLAQMSPWRLSAFLGQMVDAGITNVFEAEVFFQNMARDLREVRKSTCRVCGWDLDRDGECRRTDLHWTAASIAAEEAAKAERRATRAAA